MVPPILRRRYVWECTHRSRGNSYLELTSVMTVVLTHTCIR